MANPQQLEIIQQGAEAWNSWRQDKGHLRPNLRGADLGQANLAGAVLARANLREGKLRGADLRGANLRKASLREADLRAADLRGANLTRADLRDADLRDADLRDADLRGAALEGSLLHGADLKGAIFNKEDMQYVGQQTKSDSASPAPRPAAVGAPRGHFQQDAQRPRSTARRFPKAAVQITLGLLASCAAVGLFVAFWPSGSQMMPSTGHPADRLVLDAAASHRDVASVTTQEGVMTIHMKLTHVGQAQYLPLISLACSAINQVAEASSAIKRVRILNQSESQGWVFESPNRCAAIEQSSGMALQIAIAAGSRPLQTGATAAPGGQQAGKQP